MDKKISLVDINSGNYPSFLKKIDDPPRVLYYKGLFNKSLFENCVAVVGSRNMSEYGRRSVKDIISSMFPGKVTIVSGFMYGVDQQVHLCSLEFGLSTIAVMPCGIDMIYPSESCDLYKSIIKNGGLILSEYPPGFGMHKWTFVKRNRIVAGLSKAIVVIEGSLKSGSLLTAEYAKKYERKLYAVPGNIFERNSLGCNKLIKEGAELLDDPEAINKYLGLTLHSLFGSNSTSTEEKIITLLKNGGKSPDELAEALVINIETVITSLTKLIIEEKVIIKRGTYYAC